MTVKSVNISRCDIARRYSLAAAKNLVLSVAVLFLAACSYDNGLGRAILLYPSQDGMAAVAGKRWATLDTYTTPAQLENAEERAKLERLRLIGTRIVDAAGEDPAKWSFAILGKGRPSSEKDGSATSHTASANFVALPGGRIGVAKKIFDVLTDEALAALIAHGVAHVRYNHAGERYQETIREKRKLEKRAENLPPGTSTSFIAQSDAPIHGTELDRILGIPLEECDVRPFSDKHEIEADRFAIKFLQRAGYEPDTYLKLWDQNGWRGPFYEPIGAASYDRKTPRARGKRS